MFFSFSVDKKGFMLKQEIVTVSCLRFVSEGLNCFLFLVRTARSKWMRVIMMFEGSCIPAGA